MKGLLVKDFRLMKINIKSILMIMLMALGYNIIAGNEVAATMTGMITFIFGNIAMNSVAYDEADNGFSYIMTLPFSKKTYVIEKYIFTLLATMIGGILSILISFIFSKNLKESFATTAVVEIMVLLMASIILPIYIKFGIEKARNYMYVIYGMIIIGVFMLAKYAKSMMVNNSYIGKIFMKITTMDLLYVVLAGLAIALIVYMFSMIISINIMKKKEF